MSTEGFDVVIVGAGSSGCVVAHRLVQDTDARVLLIEAGGPDSLPAIHNTDVPSTVSLWGEPSINWGYVTEPQAGSDAGDGDNCVHFSLWGLDKNTFFGVRKPPCSSSANNSTARRASRLASWSQRSSPVATCNSYNPLATSA